MPLIPGIRRLRQDRICAWSLFLKPSMYLSTVRLFSVIPELHDTNVRTTD